MLEGAWLRLITAVLLVTLAIVGTVPLWLKLIMLPLLIVSGTGAATALAGQHREMRRAIQARLAEQRNARDHF